MGQPTILDFDAPICATCGRRMRRVADPGNQWATARFVCTFAPGHAKATTGEMASGLPA